jgi:2-phosphosulfolactate phosphatase
VDVLVIVDVLSFTTSVAVARQRVSRDAPYSLSPASLTAIPAETNLVLPSPNGSRISVLAAQLGRPILAGCLRNAAGVAAAVHARGNVVGIVASGERWPNGGLRPAYKDLVGAGARSAPDATTWNIT